MHTLNYKICSKACGAFWKIRMKTKMSAVRFIYDKRNISPMDCLGYGFDIGNNAVVSRGRNNNRLNVRIPL